MNKQFKKDKLLKIKTKPKIRKQIILRYLKYAFKALVDNNFYNIKEK